MNESKNAIMSLIHEANLLPEEVKLWEEIIENIPEKLCSDVYDTLKSVPGAARAMTENLKEKIDGIKSGDTAKLEEVLSKENDFLLSIV